MFTDSQLLYISEVLGTDPAHYRRVDGGPSAAIPHVIVWTPALNDEARALLGKILSSVALNDFVHVEGEAPGPCRHLLRFEGGQTARRDAHAGGSEWHFHALETMLGAGAEVSRRKREVWTLLQEFRRDV